MRAIRPSTLRSAIATVLSALFVFQTAAVNAAESSLWSDRRRAIAAAKPQTAENLSDAQGTRAEQGTRSADGATLLASLPAITPGLNTIQSPDLPLISLPTLDPSRSVPSWVQLAVTPFATIQSARLTGTVESPTVIVMQDAHLHVEAQRNIAGAIEALATDMSKRGEKLLVAMEGAANGPVDYSAYAAGDPAIRREVATQLGERKILSGAEVAAVATAGIAGGKDLFSTIGVENFSMYEANVRALRDTAPLRASAELAVSDLRRELVDLKKKNFDADLMRFAGRKFAYEDGKIGLPAYALYLDSEVPAQAKNLRELIEAALLENTLKFPKVEAERRRLLAKLVEKMSDAEVKGLLSVSLSFRSGQVTYAEYYSLIKRLAARHDIALATFPEMNIYIQYVLKAEGIDHRAIFTELAEEERLVQRKLASTDAQREILALDSDLHLLKKLTDRSLIESEWHAYENRAADMEKILDRIVSLGGSKPESAVAMSPKWKYFGAFYVTALARNEAMTAHLSDAAQKSGAKFSMLVAGGFHSEGLAALMGKRGYNVFVLSPHITDMGEGPSSLDFLAQGRLPLNEIFVGERLFLPTPPVTALNAAVGEQGGGRRSPATLVRTLVGGIVVALTTLRAPENNSEPVRVVQGELVIVANRGPVADAGGMKFTFPNGDEAAVGQFVSAFAGTPFNAISQAVRAAPSMHQFWPYLADFLRAAGRNVPTGRTLFSMPAQKELIRELRAIAANPGNRNDPALRLADALSRNNGLMGGFSELVFMQLIQQLRYTRAAPAIDRFIQANQRLEAVDVVPADVRGAVTAIQGQIGAAALDLTIELLSNDKTKSYSQVNEVGEGAARRYVIRVSQEFLADKIDARIDDVVRRGGFTGPQARSQARTWLLEQWAAHELAEAVLRRRAPNPGNDADLQKRAHDLLNNNGFGTTLPSERASFQRPVAALLKDLISRNASAFVEGAANRITLPTAATAAPAVTVNAAPVAPASAPAQTRTTPAPQPGSGRVAVNGYDSARRRNVAGAIGADFAMSPDGTMIVTAGGREIRFISALTGETISTIQKEAPEAMAFSADGKSLVVGTLLDEAFLVNLSNPAAPVVTPLQGHADRVTAVAFSPDGSRVLTGSWDSTVIESDAKTGRVIRTYSGNAGYVWAVGFAPDGRAFSASVYETRTWNPDGTARAVRFSEAARDGAGVSQGMAISPDGTRIAIQTGRNVNIYRTSDLTLLQQFGPTLGSAVSLAFSGDGSQLVGSFTDYRNGHQVQAFDIAPGAPPVITPSQVLRVSPSQTISDFASGYTGKVAVNRDGTRMGVAVPKERSVQLNTRTPGAAYMGWARGGFVIATVIGLTLVFGIRLDLVSSVFSFSGLTAIAVGTLISAVMIAAEETFHFSYRMAEYEKERQAFIDGLAAREFLTDEGQKKLVIQIWEEGNSPQFSFRGLKILNAGDSISVLAAGQLAFLGAGALISVVAALVFGAPSLLLALIPILGLTFLNAEALAPVGNEEFPNGGYLRRAIPQILSRFTRASTAEVTGALSATDAERTVAEVAPAPRVTMRERLSRLAGSVQIPRRGLILVSILVVSMIGSFVVGAVTVSVGAGALAMVGVGMPVMLITASIADRESSATSSTVLDEGPAPVAAPRARPAPRAVPPPPAPAPARAEPPTVTVLTSNRITATLGLFYASMARNRKLAQNGGGMKPITVYGLRDAISFYMALAAYTSGSKNSYKQMEATLRYAPGVSPKIAEQLGPLMREVIGLAPPNNVTSIDNLFNRFESDQRYRSISKEIRGYLVTAYLLKNRNAFDPSNPLSDARYQAATRSQALGAVGVERNKTIDEARNLTFYFTNEATPPLSTMSKKDLLSGKDRDLVSVDELASATRSMLAFNRAIRVDIFTRLKAEVAAMAGDTSEGNAVNQYIDDIGSAIADILQGRVPAVTPGGALVGFDTNLGVLLDILGQYANRVALRAGQPERRQEFLGRLLSAVSDEKGRAIYQWASTNVQGREQFDRIMAAIEVFENARANRAEAAQVAQTRDAEIQADIAAALVLPAEPTEPEPATADVPAPGEPLSVEEVVRRALADRPDFKFNANALLSIMPWVSALVPFMISREPDQGRQDLAVMIIRLERLEQLIRGGKVLSATVQEADRLAIAIGRLRAVFKARENVSADRVKEILVDTNVLGDTLTRAVLLPMVNILGTVGRVLDVAVDEAMPIAAFYNNNLSRVVAEAILTRPGRDAKGNAGLLADALYALRDRNPKDPVYDRLNTFLTTLNTMGSLPGRATVDSLAPMIYPLIGVADDVAKEVLSLAGLVPDTSSNASEKVTQELLGVLPFFNISAEKVKIELVRGDERTNESPVAFIQIFPGLTGPQVVIRISQATLVRIRGQVTDAGTSIAGSLAEFHQLRLARLGVRLTDQEASDLALRIFLFHELGEGVAGIRDSDLDGMGLADRERLTALDAASGVSPETAYVSADGIAGALEALEATARAVGQVRPSSDQTFAPSRADRRARELAAIIALSRALPRISQLFPNRRVINYSFGVSDGQEVLHEADGSVNRENLNVMEESPTEIDRLTAIDAEARAGRNFVEQTAEQTDKDFKIGDPGTMVVYDQTGGFKDLADRFANFTDDRLKLGTKQVIGVPQTSDELGASLEAYVQMLQRKRAQPDGASVQADLDKALALQQAVGASFSEDETTRLASRVGVVTLNGQDQALITQDATTGAWDVSAVVPIFQARAKAQFGITVQRLVFFSDWRQLVAAQLDIAVTTAMNLNVFMNVEGQMQVANLIAKQA